MQRPRTLYLAVHSQRVNKPLCLSSLESARCFPGEPMFFHPDHVCATLSIQEPHAEQPPGTRPTRAARHLCRCATSTCMRTSPVLTANVPTHVTVYGYAKHYPWTRGSCHARAAQPSRANLFSYSRYPIMPMMASCDLIDPTISPPHLEGHARLSCSISVMSCGQSVKSVCLHQPGLPELSVAISSASWPLDRLSRETYNIITYLSASILPSHVELLDSINCGSLTRSESTSSRPRTLTSVLHRLPFRLSSPSPHSRLVCYSIHILPSLTSPT